MKDSPSIFQVTPDTALWVRVFKPSSDTQWHDIFNCDFNDYDIDKFYNEAAKNIINSMQERYNIRLIRALKEHCEEILQEDQDRIKRLNLKKIIYE